MKPNKRLQVISKGTKEIAFGWEQGKKEGFSLLTLVVVLRATLIRVLFNFSSVSNWKLDISSLFKACFFFFYCNFVWSCKKGFNEKAKLPKQGKREKLWIKGHYRLDFKPFGVCLQGLYSNQTKKKSTYDEKKIFFNNFVGRSDAALNWSLAPRNWVKTCAVNIPSS